MLLRWSLSLCPRGNFNINVRGDMWAGIETIGATYLCRIDMMPSSFIIMVVVVVLVVKALSGGGYRRGRLWLKLALGKILHECRSRWSFLRRMGHLLRNVLVK